MKAWEFENIRRATMSRWLQRGGRGFNGHVCTDSRKVREGDLFIAIRGAKFDAHDFLPQVIAGRAAGILVSRDLPADVVASAGAHGVTILQADDTVAGLNRLAAAYRREIRAKVIAVGGSNGKTTTKRIIHTVLAQKFNGHASPKSYNNNIGMPLTLLEVEPHHDYVVLEIGTNAPGEIAALGDAARPDIALITSIGLEHLEKLTNLEGVAREEAAIAPCIAEGGPLIIPAGVPELVQALRLSAVPRVTVGPAGSGADLQATDIEETLIGCTFALNGRSKYQLPLLGRHNVSNALMALAVARRMGLSDEQIQAGFDAVKPEPMRLETAEIGGYFVLNDAYNANPSSMAAALETFGGLPLPHGSLRRVAILGDMLELGAASETLHRDIGAALGRRNVAMLIAIGSAMRSAADTAAAAGVAVHHFASTTEARHNVAALLKPGDAILLKGSRGMGLEKVLDSLVAPAAAEPQR